MTWRDRYIPILVASPLFLQSLDTSVMATALPSIARALGVPTLHLNLAITAYLLSLAVFLPVSGWLAERFGARRVFCAAIVFFGCGSALCGLANSLPELVGFRILQGMGGAMMVPVARLILLRTVAPAFMVSAMVWFTIPPTIGRMVGPLVGGAIVTLASWRWIFLINVPFVLLAVVLAWWLIDDIQDSTTPEPLDVIGFVLLALGLAGLLGALETTGKHLVPGWFSALLAVVGTVALVAYWRRTRTVAHPVIDLTVIRFPTFRTSLIGGTPLRVAIGASPFLLPLMLQLGFGLSALQSGFISFASALGALATRTVIGLLIRRLGFRTLLIGATALSSLAYMSYSLFTPATPHALIFVTLLLGGLVNSMCMVAMQTLGFSEIPKPRLSHATVLNSMAQQVSQSFGVVLGAALVLAAGWWHGSPDGHPGARDFGPAFVFIGLMTLISIAWFVHLRADQGDEMR